MTDSILQSVKEGLLIVDTYDAFDNRIIVMINSVISELWQIGYSPAKGFQITGPDETWDDLIFEPRFNMVKSFIIEKVTLMFDPPPSSQAVDNMKADCDELAWRIRAEEETGEGE